ncbi:MAG: hypothetical protein GXP19_01115 [Gammaproteobacteria bacterium]|nr:hypothetical protein [Gammaproteobacteria bacterium]
MISVFKSALIILSCLVLINCASQGGGETPSVKDSNLGSLFVFSETAPGSAPAEIKMFINDNFMRIDDDNTPNDYILFDRKKKIINNVVSESKTVFVIKEKKIDIEPPIKINYEYVKKASGVVTKNRNGTKAFHYKFSANESECYNVVTVENYMTDALEAFKEFRLMLAGEHSKTMSRIPGEEYDACDLALNIFESSRHLQYGFPVREWDKNGYQRFLVDVRSNLLPPDNLLILPEGYKSYSVSE